MARPGLRRARWARPWPLVTGLVACGVEATDGPIDAGVEAADAQDGVTDGDAIQAVVGARCEPDERVGQVDIAYWGASHDLYGWLDDRPDPWVGRPALTSDACVFHRFDPASACPTCDVDEMCAVGGACVTPPEPQAARLTITAGGEAVTFDAPDGHFNEELSLPGDRYALELSFADVRVVVPAIEIPGELADLEGTLIGTRTAPRGLSLSWSRAGLGDSQVFTSIRINHHRAGPTFTECAVPASRGGFDIQEAMLAPLAVSTGLEFQSVEHTRFAAAATPRGCVEFRLRRRHSIEGL